MQIPTLSLENRNNTALIGVSNALHFGAVQVTDKRKFWLFAPHLLKILN